MLRLLNKVPAAVDAADTNLDARLMETFTGTDAKQINNLRY